MGRIGAAVRALRGHAAPCRTCELHIRSIQAEWRSFELELTGYMERMNAWAARQAKRDKRSADRILDEGSQPGQLYEGPSPQTSKAELRSQYAATIAARRVAGRVSSNVPETPVA